MYPCVSYSSAARRVVHVPSVSVCERPLDPAAPLYTVVVSDHMWLLLCGVAVLIWCGWPFFTSLGELLALFLAIIVGILEIPFLCVCTPTCQKLSMKLEVFEQNILLRGGLYAGLGLFALVLCLIVGDADDEGWVESHWSLTLTFILLVADGVAYIAGHIRKEDNSAGGTPPATTGKPVATAPPANP